MTTTPEDARDAQDSFWRRTRRVALWSVVVGVVLELSILGLLALGPVLPDGARALAQVASKVSWSVVVCLGISLGLAVSNGREQLMGFLGAISGPAGFAVARSVHKGTLQMITSGPVVASPDLLSPFLLAGVKALEYGVFGLWLGRISRDGRARIGLYLRAGALIGVVFGTLFLLLYARAKPDAEGLELVSKGLNELVFPIGCALVLFVSKRTTAAGQTALVP